MKRLFGSVAGMCVVLCALRAAAAPQPIAVLGIDTTDAPESAATTLVESLRERLASTKGVELVAKRDFMEIKMLYGCIDPSAMTACLAKVGRTMKADRVIFGAITGRGRKAVHVALKLADSTSERIVGSVDEDVLLAEVPQQASRWLRVLLPQLVEESQLIVRSSPAGAEVEVDGHSAGRTPAMVPLAPGGVYNIVIGKAGMSPQSRKVTTRAGETVTIELQLAPLPTGDAPPPAVVEPSTSGAVEPSPAATGLPGEHPGRGAKIAGVGLIAVAAVGAGIAIYTWRHYVDLQGEGRNALLDLQMRNPDYARTHRESFEKPDCKFAGSPPATGNVDAYVQKCNDGNAYASATTGLWLGVGVVAAAAIGSLAYGVYKDRKATDAPSKSVFAPRLRVIAPVVSQGGGGLAASFEF